MRNLRRNNSASQSLEFLSIIVSLRCRVDVLLSNLSRVGRRAFLVGLLATSLGACTAPVIRTPKEEVEKLPLVDVHAHYGQSGTPEDFLDAMQAAGIARMVLFGGQNAADLALQQPDRFAASLQGVIITALRRGELRYGTEVEVIKRIIRIYNMQLRSGVYKALGEFAAYHDGARLAISPTSLLIRSLLELAGKYNVPINIHCSSTGALEMDLALREYPKTVVVWAHAGSHLSPSVIRDFLQVHPNLYFDLSAKHPPWTYQSFFKEHILIGNAIDEDWRQLFESYPDRFLVGTDLGMGGGGSTTPLGMARNVGEFFQTMLMQLTPSTARKIAYENAEKLYRFK